MLESKEMRHVYCETMLELAATDARIVDIQADLTAAHAMKPFQQAYPDRTFNVGVAEANMIGIAAGLATCGKVPFVHSFATFASRRCFDQIAISVCYAGLNVKIIGSDPGVGAELNGGTHMALEDVGIMRTLPHMTIFEPVDSIQLKKALPVIVAHPKPVYIRLFRRKAHQVFSSDYNFQLGKADTLRQGTDVAIIASGVCVYNALEAAKLLENKGISAEVINVHTIKPLDAASIIAAAKKTKAVVTAENHSIIGGLGSAVAETLSESCPTPVVRIGVQDHFGQVGKQDYLEKIFKITPDDIMQAAQKAISLKA